MQRIIKFRAWDKKGKTMYLFGLKDMLEDKIKIVLNCDDDVTAIMQYTGLRDKNGKECYWDDVLKWRDSTFQIVWDDKCACVMLKRLSGIDGMSEIPAHNIKQGEVIGNIQQNPELLEVTDG